MITGRTEVARDEALDALLAMREPGEYPGVEDRAHIVDVLSAGADTLLLLLLLLLRRTCRCR